MVGRVCEVHKIVEFVASRYSVLTGRRLCREGRQRLCVLLWLQRASHANDRCRSCAGVMGNTCLIVCGPAKDAELADHQQQCSCCASCS